VPIIDTEERHESLVVIISDRLSTILEKGEVVDRYYNPGNLFRNVHIVLTNDDRPDAQKVQRMVGDAKLHLYNLPAGKALFVKSLGWQRLLLKWLWLERGLDLIRGIRPQLIRVHNCFLEGYLAREAKIRFGIPYVVSLHGVWDRDEVDTAKGKIIRFFREKLERQSLGDSDAALCVYQPIVRYARDHGARNVHLVYNIVAGSSVRQKTNYALSPVPRLITVNRQLKEKNPENIIRAAAELGCEYLLVGTGAYHEQLKALVTELGCADRIKFISAMPNEQLCALYADYDIMVAHCDYWGMSKTTIEGALAGLPIVLNLHPAEPIPEYEGGWVELCENSVAGYKNAIRNLLDNLSMREALGRHAFSHAQTTFDPEVMEQKTIDIYVSAIAQLKVNTCGGCCSSKKPANPP